MRSRVDIGAAMLRAAINAKGPYVHGDQFAVRFESDVTSKRQKRMHPDEVGLYTLRNGKIVEENFFMGAA